MAGYLVEFRIRPMPDPCGDERYATAVVEVDPIYIGGDGHGRFKQRSRKFVMIDDAIEWAKIQMDDLRAEQKGNLP